MDTVKVELDFQDMNVPVYTEFWDVQDGWAVLYGLNARPMNGSLLLHTPKIMGRDCSMSYYLPKPDSNVSEVRKRLAGLPKKSLVWLAGEYRNGFLKVQDCGASADFPNGEMARKLDKEFREYLDPDVFEYLSEKRFGIYFCVSGRVEDGTDVSILDKGNNKVAVIPPNQSARFKPFNGKNVRFNALVRPDSFNMKEKILYPL